MKRSFSLLASAASRLAPVWLFTTILLAAALFFGLFGLSRTASGQPLPASNPVADSVPVASTNTLEIAQSSIHTVTLPLIAKAYRPVEDSLLGVEMHDLDWNRVVKMADAGARWARIALSWGSIEPENTTPENYQWPTARDAQIANLSSRNVKVIFLLNYNPSWAATYPGGPIDQVDISELVEFMTAAVAHYSVPPYNVKYWEIYSEVDNGDALYAEWGWGYFGNQPEEYVNVLRELYQPIKNIDPEAQIVFSGIAYDNWTTNDPPGPFVPGFLPGVLQNDGALYFDVMNFHYYPAFHGNWDGPDGMGIAGKAAALREELALYNVDKPFICTEASMWSAALYGGDDESQSRYPAQVFARSMAADLGATIWFWLEDDPGAESWKYGLLDTNLDPKPSYWAYQTVSWQLAPTDYVRTLSTAETGSDQIEAHEFLTHDGLTHIIDVWTNDEQQYELSIAADQVVEVDKWGDERTVLDGDDGVQDGFVHTSVGPSPVFLRFSP